MPVRPASLSLSWNLVCAQFDVLAAMVTPLISICATQSLTSPCKEPVVGRTYVIPGFEQVRLSRENADHVTSVWRCKNLKLGEPPARRKLPLTHAIPVHIEVPGQDGWK